jgi:signal transduction histidine kinase
MGVQFKITLAFSVVFIVLCSLFGLIGYHQVHGMMIRVAVNHETLDANLRSLRNMILAICLLAVLISALTSYVVASLLLVPLQRIIHAARNFATNKMQDPIPVNGTKDELQELSVTINEMILRIDEAVHQQQNFFASASHELKTPLAILQTELEVGLRKPALEEGLRQLLSNQLEEISRLQSIVI